MRVERPLYLNRLIDRMHNDDIVNRNNMKGDEGIFTLRFTWGNWQCEGWRAYRSMPGCLGSASFWKRIPMNS